MKNYIYILKINHSSEISQNFICENYCYQLLLLLFNFLDSLVMLLLPFWNGFLVLIGPYFGGTILSCLTHFDPPTQYLLDIIAMEPTCPLVHTFLSIFQFIFSIILHPRQRPLVRAWHHTSSMKTTTSWFPYMCIFFLQHYRGERETWKGGADTSPSSIDFFLVLFFSVKNSWVAL